MNSPETRVLLIEDNPGDVELASILLAGAKGAAFHLETRERLGSGLERLAQGGIDVLLLDLSLPDSSGIATFERVHAAAPLLPVVVMSNLDDEQTAMRAVEIGAQDYLVKGRHDSTSLARALCFAMERQKRQAAAAARKPGKVLAFAGAKGGVGTTTLVLNFAVCIAQANKSVIAVELRPNFGTFAPCLGHVPTANLSSLLELPSERITEKEVALRLTEFPFGVKVMFGPQASQEFRPMEAEKAEVLLEKLVSMADYVVVDLPDATSAASQVAARRAKLGAVVLNSDAVSILCGKRVLDELRAAGASRPSLKAVVVNRVAPAEGIRLDDIAMRLEAEVVGVVVPAPELCLNAEKAGVPFTLFKPNHIASGTVYDMVEKVLASDRLKLSALAAAV